MEQFSKHVDEKNLRKIPKFQNYFRKLFYKLQLNFLKDYCHTVPRQNRCSASELGLFILCLNFAIENVDNPPDEETGPTAEQW